MDPISVIFSTFITGISSGITTDISDIMGTELQYKVVEYHQLQIDFQYQMWTIKDKSVCARDKDNDLSAHSKCTVEAKRLFGDTCSYLQANPQQSWQYKKTKNMYCTASANFKPTVAQISTPSAAEAALWNAKQACSMLTLQARSSGSKQVITDKEKACSKYNQLK